MNKLGIRDSEPANASNSSFTGLWTTPSQAVYRGRGMGKATQRHPGHLVMASAIQRRDPSTLVHLHIYYSHWTHESRAWRAGTAALENGFAGKIIYVGSQGADQHGIALPDITQHGPKELIERLPPIPNATGGSKWKRAFRLPSWWANVVRRYGVRKDIGLIVAHSLASLPAAVLLKLRTGAPLLYDAHELESHREGWSAPIRLIAGFTESLLIGFAGHTLIVNRSIHDWYRRRYPHMPLTILRNISNAKPPIRRSDKLRRDAGLGPDDLICLYLGAFVEGRGIDEISGAFQNAAPDKHVVFVGFGPLEANLRDLAKRNPNVHVLPAVPSSEVLTYASGADVGVALIRDSSLNHRYSLPNKVFEYALAGLGVIVSDVPEQRRFIEETGRGWVIPGHSTALAELIGGLTRESVRAQLEAGAFAPPSWQDEVQGLLQVYSKLLGGEGWSGGGRD
jgi:glycosyltransferase involved in cell wall biosynthesis